MAIRIDGTNTIANPGITGADTDTGLQLGTDELKLVTGGTEAVKIDSNQKLTASQGILFGTDTAAANTLGDYEEGTFTPTITDATSYTTQAGYYTKVGRLVTFAIRVQPSAGTGSASGLEIGGLPFTSVSISSGPYGGAYRSFGTLVDEGTIVNLNWHMPANNTIIRALSSGALIATNNSAVNLVGNLILNGFYYT